MTGAMNTSPPAGSRDAEIELASYSYPDAGDQIPRQGIDPVWVIAGADWDEADLLMVRRAAALLSGGRALSCVDVGAGQGRLLPAVLAVADEVTIIEPDAQRLSAARDQAVGLDRERSHFLCTDLAGAKVGATRFDLVVCSHVLQHLPTGQRAGFLASLRSITATDGLLVLMYSATSRGPGRLMLSEHLPGSGGVRTREVDTADFDRAAMPSRTTGPTNSLPVWHAGAGDVESLLSQAAMTILSRTLYRRFRAIIETAGRRHTRYGADVCIVSSPRADRSV